MSNGKEPKRTEKNRNASAFLLKFNAESNKSIADSMFAIQRCEIRQTLNFPFLCSANLAISIFVWSIYFSRT
jgi:hypothetical protein